ncbi:hypothetical protein [Alkaliphilus crotonatoxidans]
MKKESVRSLDQMPAAIKQAYCKLLMLMVKAGDGGNQLKLAELYRLMGNIKLRAEARINLLKLLIRDDENLALLVNSLMKGVNQQEKNIIRFSLIKDLVIIMKADYVVDSEENLLLLKLVNLLDISEEQLQFFLDEHEQDQTFQVNIEHHLHEEIAQEATAKAMALGIPLGMIYFSGGSFHGFGPVGIVKGLKRLGMKKYTKDYSIITGIATVILVSYGAYHSTKWLMGRGSRKEKRYRALLYQEMAEIHFRAIHYAEKDLARLGQKIQEIQDQEEKQRQLSVYKLLDKTLGTLKNTKPKLI